MIQWRARIRDARGNYRYDSDIAPMTLEHAQFIVRDRTEASDYLVEELPFVIEAWMEDK